MDTLQASGQFHMDSIGVLELANLSIDNIDKKAFDECTTLHMLDLSGNALRDIAGLTPCTGLQRLNLSQNKITNLSLPARSTADSCCDQCGAVGVELPPSLEELRLDGNKLGAIEDIRMLKSLPNLRALYLQGADGSKANSICKSPQYPNMVLTLLPELTNLDGMRRSVGDEWPPSCPRAKEIKLPPAEPWKLIGTWLSCRCSRAGWCRSRAKLNCGWIGSGCSRRL